MESSFRRHAVIFVLVFGYVLLSLLVLQQGRTIDSQRTLIKQLFHDSVELNVMKVQQAQSARR